jgi:hypothetical protein
LRLWEDILGISWLLSRTRFLVILVHTVLLRARAGARDGRGEGRDGGGVEYTMKKWGMAAYFAWNGYELRDERISQYDVTKQEVGVGVA